MDTIHKLQELFARFPGIGPRQAGRFVQYILRSSPSFRRELADAIARLGDEVKRCADCQRFFAGTRTLCGICGNTQRDQSLLMVVAQETDIDAIERADTYRGHYFILGGTMMLGQDTQPHLREAELLSTIKKRVASGLTEVILALPANPEGDTTAAHLKEKIAPLIGTISILGRGLSTGSELEYADVNTIRAALQGRG